MIEERTGHQVSGSNTKGSVLLAVILEEGENFQPIPLLYVPVTDYAAFLKGLSNGRTEGNIATVQLAKGAKQMIVGQQGLFAVFTEPNCKDALQEALRSTPGAGATYAAIASQITRNDITGVLTSRGIKIATGKTREALLGIASKMPLSYPLRASLCWGGCKARIIFLKKRSNRM